MFQRLTPDSPDPVTLRTALASGKKVPPDATALLADDHRTVLGWFEHYESLAQREQKVRLWQSIRLALRAHMAAEEEVFYPELEHLGRGSSEQAREEHAEAKIMIESLEAELDDDLVSQLGAAIADHVAGEESELFPIVQKDSSVVHALGAELASRRIEALHSLVGGIEARGGA